MSAFAELNSQTRKNPSSKPKANVLTNKVFFRRAVADVILKLFFFF